MARPPIKVRMGTKTRKRKRKVPNYDVSVGEEVTLDLPDDRSNDDPRKDEGGDVRSKTTKTGHSMSTRAGGTATDKQEHGVKEPVTSNEGKKLKRKGLSFFTTSTGDKNEKEVQGQLSKGSETNPTRPKKRKVQFAGSYADPDYDPDESDDMDYDETPFSRSKLNVNTKKSNNSQVRKGVHSSQVPDLMINNKPFISLRKIREMEVKERKEETEMKRKKKEEKMIAQKRGKNKNKPMYACGLCNFRNESLGAFYHHTEVNHGDEVLKLVLARERKQQCVQEVKDEIELKVEKIAYTEENIVTEGELEPDVEVEVEMEEESDVEEEVDEDEEPEATEEELNAQLHDDIENEDDSESVVEVTSDCKTLEGGLLDLSNTNDENEPADTSASNAGIFRCTILKVPNKISEEKLAEVLKGDFPEHFDNDDMVCIKPVTRESKRGCMAIAVISGAKGTLEDLQRASIGKRMTYTGYHGRTYEYQFAPVAVCALCSREFETAKKLRSHQLVAHRGKKLLLPNGNLVFPKRNDAGIVTADEIGKVSWECQDCECVYTAIHMLRHHVAVMHPNRQCKMIVNDKEIEPKIIPKIRHIKVKCDNCNVEFSSKYALSKHIVRFHEGPGAKKILMREAEMIKTRKPTFICDECSNLKIFSSKNLLREHIAIVHADLLPYNKNGIKVDRDSFMLAKKIGCPCCEENITRGQMAKHIQCYHALNCTVYFEDYKISSSKIQKRFKICPIKGCRKKMSKGLRITGHLRTYHKSRLPMKLAPDFIVTLRASKLHITSQDLILNKSKDIEYACPVCTFAINSEGAYYHHLEVNHHDILLKELEKRRGV